MNSKRVEEYIQYYRHKAPYTEGDFDAWRVYEAVELAEMDMADKAIQAFSESCEMYAGGGICLENGRCESCGRVMRFQQKLMEE